MKYRLTDYRTLIFDCDGVILDSNKVKTKAFYQATLPYGKAAARAMVDYHVANGGVSRYRKFSYFLENIVSAKAQQQGPGFDALLRVYSDSVREGLLSCDLAPGLAAFRKITLNGRWLVVSGGDQAELRDLFSQRNIAEYFDGGIFGSPDTKDEILRREIASGKIGAPALFIGDSLYDYEASYRAGLDFAFLKGWSELPESDYQRLGDSPRFENLDNFMRSRA